MATVWSVSVFVLFKPLLFENVHSNAKTRNAKYLLPNDLIDGHGIFQGITMDRLGKL